MVAMIAIICTSVTSHNYHFFLVVGIIKIQSLNELDDYNTIGCPDPPQKLLVLFNPLIFRLPRWLSGKEPTCQSRRCNRLWFDPWVGKIPWGRAWQPIPVFLPGESHGQWSLVG